MWKKSLGVIAMAGAIGVLALSSNGCSSSSSGSSDDDGGGDAKPRLDAGDTDSGAACKPADVKSFQPTWQPPGVTLGSCSPTQIDGFITGCFADASTPQSCAAFRSANAACDKCVVTGNDGPKLGVIVVPPQGQGLPTFNIAGCLAITANDLSANSCGAKEQAIEQCVEAACTDNCPIPSSSAASSQEIDAAITAFNNCEDSAAADGCAAFNGSASCLDDLAGDGGPGAKCFVDASDPNHDVLLARNLIQLFCGGAVVGDGGSDGATQDAADGGG